MDKKEYIEPTMEIIYFENEDVIVTSGDGAGAGGEFTDE